MFSKKKNNSKHEWLKVYCIFSAGHGKAVRDICFNNAGTRFLSAAYDRYIKLWDTETGRLVILHTVTWRCGKYQDILSGCKTFLLHQLIACLCVQAQLK